MTDLLWADLARLWKNKVFWVSVALMVFLETGGVLNGSRQAKLLAAEGYTRALDDYYFTPALALGLFVALVVGLFLGTEYSDGTLRNKLIVGRTRRQVYLSSLFTGFTVALLLTGAMLLSGLAGIPGLGLWEMGPKALALHILVILSSTLALSALFTLVGMLSEKKSTTAVATILLFLALFLLASWIYARLCEPETNTGIIITAAGMEFGDPTPNPNYVGGTLRDILRLLVDCLPTGQTLLIASDDLGRPILGILSSAALTVLATFTGMTLFQRKDLK